MTCLSIVIDCDARHWGELTEKENNENMICTLINSITSYTTAHMSLSAANRIIIIGADSALSEPTIYATNASTDIDMNSAVKTAIRNALKKSASSTNTTDSAVFAPAIAVAICHICRYKNEIDNGDGRILVINIGNDFLREHNILMNIFFAAHKQNILIDVANIGETSPILQQASDITGGTYLNVKKPRQLLQYTMCFMLGKASLRSAFPSPSSSTSVDYRASCHCHGVPVSIGWVCSVCLSVQCHFSPICPACKSVHVIVLFFIKEVNIERQSMHM
uniref:General transcription factor IIH subunit 3 n=1 Tax=Onchocerca volvulus TaxID=6282 RepID=A0A8R1TYW0_ONCVO